MYDFLFTQTLTELSLQSNGIGPLGAQYLANALQQNKVTYHSVSYLAYASFLFIQTLTTLYLLDNQIGAGGAQYLADALKQNKVTHHSVSFLSCACFSLHTDTHNTQP
jgi:Ran GTPase-activating protein (RanGAP) involved in mRNA processing and transport